MNLGDLGSMKPVVLQMVADMRALAHKLDGYDAVDRVIAEEIARNPEKSSSAIAKETGVSEATIRRARTSSFDEVEKRQGQDGKMQWSALQYYRRAFACRRS